MHFDPLLLGVCFIRTHFLKIHPSFFFSGRVPGLLFLAKHRARWVYNLVAREACAQRVNRAWVLASCKLAALIFACIFPMVSAMTSYSSWRHGAFLFLGNIRVKTISNSHQWPKHLWRAVSAKQCLISVNLKPFLMQTEQQTQERRIVNPRRGRFDPEKSSGAKNADLKFNGASNKDGWR